MKDPKEIKESGAKSDFSGCYSALNNLYDTLASELLLGDEEEMEEEELSPELQKFDLFF